MCFHPQSLLARQKIKQNALWSLPFSLPAIFCSSFLCSWQGTDESTEGQHILPQGGAPYFLHSEPTRPVPEQGPGQRQGTNLGILISTERCSGDDTSATAAHGKINQDTWRLGTNICHQTLNLGCGRWYMLCFKCRLWMVHTQLIQDCQVRLYEYWYLDSILLKSTKGVMCSTNVNEIKKFKIFLINTRKTKLIIHVNTFKHLLYKSSMVKVSSRNTTFVPGRVWCCVWAHRHICYTHPRQEPGLFISQVLLGSPQLHEARSPCIPPLCHVKFWSCNKRMEITSMLYSRGWL